MSQELVIKTLYRCLLVTASRLTREVARLKTSDVFSDSELSRLKPILPFLSGSIVGGEGLLKDVIRNRFRAPLQPAPREEGTSSSATIEAALEERLDEGFSTLSLVNRRLSLLRSLPAECTSDSVTHGIRVTVEAYQLLTRVFVPGNIFMYKVRILNESVPTPVQVVSRYWKITDMEGGVREVVGPGVVGAQPTLNLGEHYEYTSSLILCHRRGGMSGSYQMVSHASGEVFDVEVAPFALVVSKEAPGWDSAPGWGVGQDVGYEVTPRGPSGPDGGPATTANKVGDE